MRNIHIDDSYNIWPISDMRNKIDARYTELTGDAKKGQAGIYLNRTYFTMYIEWWLHNIGYYITAPFCGNAEIKRINVRFKHVDLEEWE